MNEHGFVRKVHKDLRASKCLKKIWKINDNFQGGVPDAFYLGRRELWIEYKFLPKLPKRHTTLIIPDVSELQYGWLTDLQTAGKPAWVVVGHTKGVWISEDLPLCRRGVTQADFLGSSVDYSVFIQRVLDVCA